VNRLSSVSAVWLADRQCYVRELVYLHLGTCGRDSSSSGTYERPADSFTKGCLSRDMALATSVANNDTTSAIRLCYMP